MTTDEMLPAPQLSVPDHVRVYVNERGVSVGHDATALDAVAALLPEAAAAITAGTSRLTDSRGLSIDAGVRVHGGLILRVLPVRAQAGEAQGTDPQVVE